METGEPFMFTRSWFLKIVENETEWERSLKGVPEFDVGKLKSYLTESRNKTFDKEGMRTYKSLKAYKYFEGYVQKIASVKKGDEFFIRAEVMASMAKKVYKPYVSLSMRGDVRGGSCDCVAGKGEACSHIAALLFAVDDFVSKGFQDLPGDKTVTDRLCEWNKPASRTVEPKTIHNIRIVKQEHGKVLQERQTLAASAFDPRQPADRTRDDGHFTLLVETLRAANPTCGFMKYNSEVRTDKVHAQEKTPVQKLNLPPSLADLRTACNSFKESMKISEEGIQTGTRNC